MLRVRSWSVTPRPSLRDGQSPRVQRLYTGATESTQAHDVAMPNADELRELVQRIQQGESRAKQRLFEVFNRGIRFQLVRQLGTADLDDKVHDTFVIVLQAIVRRDLRDPEKLLAYVRTVVRRQIATYIERAVHTRKETHEYGEVDSADPAASPEETLLSHEERRIMRETLSALATRDREILIRFYIDEMPMEEICREMGLSEDQFRLLKSRAKARFSELGRRQLRPKLLARYCATTAQ